MTCVARGSVGDSDSDLQGYGECVCVCVCVCWVRPTSHPARGVGQNVLAGNMLRYGYGFCVECSRCAGVGKEKSLEEARTI